MVPMGDEDKPKWNASKTSMFSCSNTWDSTRVTENVVDWWSLVWFPFSIPK
jgi:hypothetical protein